MCEDCDDSLSDERNQFLIGLGLVALTNYSELNPRFAPLSASGFSADVRRHILGKIPAISANFTPIRCPYCGQEKDARSMELDHIVPVATYIRFRAFETYGSHRTPTAVEAFADAKRFLVERQNLIFACKSCNKEKRKTVPDIALAGTLVTQGAAIHALFDNAPAARKDDLEALKKTIDKINAATPLGRYIRGRLVPVEAKTRAGSGRMRVSQAPKARPTPYDRPDPPAPALDLLDLDAGRNGNDMLPLLHLTAGALVEIQGALSRVVVVSRPNQRTTMGAALWDELLAAQTPSAQASAQLRVCLYCEGLFHDSAFQIEHTKPVNRSMTEAIAVGAYNDALLAICGSCNASRQNSRLDGALLDGLVARRKAQKLTGIESLCADLAGQATARVYALFSS